MPTYKRPSFALRNMQYWSGKEVLLFVLDGSDEKIPDDQLALFDSNIKYYHLPIPMTERLNFVKNLITTEYVSLLGDDEFLLPTGIEACIHAIEEQNLVACLGRSLFFFLNSQGLVAEPLNHEPYSPWHPGFKNYKLLDDKAGKRVVKHMNPYLCTTFYAVTKTFIWKKSITAYQNETSSADCPEVALELSNAFQGKSKVINNLMWLRSGENTPMLLYGERKDYIKFGKWYDNPKYNDEKDIFITKIAGALFSETEGYQKNEIYRIIKSGCESFALFERTRFYGQFGLPELIMKGHLIFKPMKYLVYKKIRQLFEKASLTRSEEYGFDETGSSLYERAAAWEKNGIGVDLKEIKEINDLIINFHLHNTQPEKTHETE